MLLSSSFFWPQGIVVKWSNMSYHKREQQSCPARLMWPCLPEELDQVQPCWGLLALERIPDVLFSINHCIGYLSRIVSSKPLSQVGCISYKKLSDLLHKTNNPMFNCLYNFFFFLNCVTVQETNFLSAFGPSWVSKILLQHLYVFAMRCTSCCSDPSWKKPGVTLFLIFTAFSIWPPSAPLVLF